ncbi:MAG: ABC transporter permease [Candidatus Aquicultorales bacterium]
MRFQLTLAFRYLAGRKLRTVLTTLAVVFGVMVIFGLNGMLPTFEKAFRNNMMAGVDKVDLTITSETRGTFDAGLVKKVRETDGVDNATGSLGRNIILPQDQSLKTKDGRLINSVNLKGLDPETAGKVRSLDISSGRAFERRDGDVVIISETLAEDTGLKIGDELSIPSASGLTDFTVVGISSGKPVAGVEEISVPLGAAQKLFDQANKINTIEALFIPGSDREAVGSGVLKNLGGGFKVGGNEVGTEWEGAMDMGAFILNMIGALALAMGGFIILNTFRTVVAERRRDIGMLRAVGASRGTIRGLFLTESIVQGVIGTGIGMIAGYLMMMGMLAVMRPIFDDMLHIPMGNPTFAPSAFVLAVVMGVGVTIAGGLYPAITASRVTPLEALRPAVGQADWRSMSKRLIIGGVFIGFALLGLVSGEAGLASLGALIFLVGLIVMAPALVRPIAVVFGKVLSLVFAREGHLAEGNLARQPGRAAITASSMMIGLAILVAVAGLVSSMENGVTSFVDKSMGADYLVIPQSVVLGSGNVGAGPELVRGMENVDGIEGVTTLRMSKSVMKGSDIQVIGIDAESYPGIAGLEFVAGDPSKAYEAVGKERAVIVNGVFAAQNDLKVGEDLELKTPEGPRSYKVAGVGSDYLNLKVATGYISQANLERDFHETSDVLLMANQIEGANSGAVERGLDKVVKGYPAFTLFSSGEFKEEIMTTLRSVMKVYYGLVFVMAVPSLIALVNTLAINVIERTREIGMLRAVGATRRQIRKIILGESLLLAATGTGFGILAGLWMGYVLIGSLAFVGFKVPYYFPYTGILLTIAVGLIFGVLGALIPARQAARLDIVTALHYE